ncbi:unnamed protein product, partial [Pylaiella littoralis]
ILVLKVRKIRIFVLPVCCVPLQFSPPTIIPTPTYPPTLALMQLKPLLVPAAATLAKALEVRSFALTSGTTRGARQLLAQHPAQVPFSCTAAASCSGASTASLPLLHKQTSLTRAKSATAVTIQYALL